MSVTRRAVWRRFMRGDSILGLYRIDSVEITRKPDGSVDSVRVVATCTTGLE